MSEYELAIQEHYGTDYTRVNSLGLSCDTCGHPGVGQSLTAVQRYWGMGYHEGTDYFCNTCFLRMRLEGVL